MASTVRSLSGAAVAAAAMYWLDPTCGRRRRARFRDRIVSVAREVRNGIAVGSRDLAHRLRGVTRGLRTLFDDDAVDDPVLSARVRACIGRVVAHPGALEVTAVRGRIFLRGAILAQEHGHLMRTVASVR